jgi:hypothetical protein
LHGRQADQSCRNNQKFSAFFSEKKSFLSKSVTKEDQNDAWHQGGDARTPDGLDNLAGWRPACTAECCHRQFACH